MKHEILFVFLFMLGFGMSNALGFENVLDSDKEEDFIFLHTFGNVDSLSGPLHMTFHDDLLYVAENGPYRMGIEKISVFDTDGNHVRTIGEGFLYGPTHLAFHDDLLYVTDVTDGNSKWMDERIVVFDTDGNHMRTIVDTVPRPQYLAFHEDLLYVINPFLSMAKYPIDVFDMDGNLVRSIGEGRGQYIRSITFHDDLLYAADDRNNKISVFDTEGNQMRTIGEGFLYGPTHLAFHDDLLYVVDEEDGQIVVFDTEGNHVRTINEGLDYPRHLTFHDDLLYAADDRNNKISVFDTEGNHVRTIDILAFGDISIVKNMDNYVERSKFNFIPPTLPHLNLISNNNLLYVGDYKNNQILVFDLNPKLPLPSVEVFVSNPSKKTPKLNVESTEQEESEWTIQKPVDIYTEVDITPNIKPGNWELVKIESYIRSNVESVMDETSMLLLTPLVSLPVLWKYIHHRNKSKIPVKMNTVF